MSARNEDIESLEEEVADLRRKINKLTQPGCCPPDNKVVLRIGPPHYAAGQGGYVYDPDGTSVVGPVIINLT